MRDAATDPCTIRQTKHKQNTNKTQRLAPSTLISQKKKKQSLCYSTLASVSTAKERNRTFSTVPYCFKRRSKASLTRCSGGPAGRLPYTRVGVQERATWYPRSTLALCVTCYMCDLLYVSLVSDLVSALYSCSMSHLCATWYVSDLLCVSHAICATCCMSHLCATYYTYV